MAFRLRLSAGLALPVFLVFALATACEDQIVMFGDRDAGSTPPSSGGGHEGGGNAASMSMDGGSTSISPTGGVAGGNNAGGAGGAGGGNTCGAGADFFQMTIQRFDRSTFGCSIAPIADVGPITLHGVVLASDGTSLTVDECAPDQGCQSPLSTTVNFSAAGLVGPSVPIGNFVEIEFDVAVEWGGCTQRLFIADYPVWDGIDNPGGSDRNLWLAAADGNPDAFVDEPFDTVKIGIGCGTSGIDAYALQFYLPSDAANMIEVFQGQVGSWPVDLSPSDSAWLVKNLRSYQTGNTNDATNWAYWITPATAHPD